MSFYRCAFPVPLRYSFLALRVSSLTRRLLFRSDTRVSRRAFPPAALAVRCCALILAFRAARFLQLHSLSSGLKAFCTDSMRFGVETCRLSCGGHGYSHASGLPKIYIHAVAACTYEGENTVMYLQCGRSGVRGRTR